jgi:hypothetical protein
MEEAQKEPKNTLGPFLQALRDAFLHLDDDEFESEVDMERRRRFSERKMPAKKYSHEDRQQLGITTMACKRGISNNNYKKLAPFPMVHVARASAVVAAFPVTHVAAAATASARTGKDESARRSYTCTTSGQGTRKRPPPSAPMESSSEGEDANNVAKKPKYSESSSPGRSGSTSSSSSSSSSITTDEANRLVGRATDYHLQQHGGWSTAITPTNNNEANNVLAVNHSSTPDATTPVDTAAVSPEVVGSSFSFPSPPSPRQQERRRERLAKRLMAQQQREQQQAATLSSWRTLATPEPVRSISSSAVVAMSTAGQKKRSVTGGGGSRSYKSPSKSDRPSGNDSGGGRGGGSSGGGPKSNKKKAPRPDRPRSSSSSIPRGTHLSFEMRLSHLKRFKKAYGHTLVPTIYTGYHNLGLYVSRIKHKYNNIGNMPPEQVKKLDEIGFDWSLRRKMK